MDKLIARGLLLGDIIALSPRQLVRWECIKDDTTARVTWPCHTDDPYRAVEYLLLRLKRAIDAYETPASGIWEWSTMDATTRARLPIDGHLAALGITGNHYGQTVYHMDFLLTQPVGYQPKRRSIPPMS